MAILEEEVWVTLTEESTMFYEKFMINLLNQLDIDFKPQKILNWLLKRKYDFYIPFLNFIIETYGTQHYEESFSRAGGRSLKDKQENDTLKEKITKENGIVKSDCELLQKQNN